MDNPVLIMITGFIMGFFGSVPPTGPVAMMVINRAFRGQPKFAFAAGVGGAIAEIIYSAMAVTGVGLVVEQLAGAQTLIRGLSGAVLLALGGYFLWSSTHHHDFQGADQQVHQSLRSSMSHLAKGFSVAIVNPSLILNWTVAVAFFFSLFQVQANMLGRGLFVVGVGAGMIVWTALEVWLLGKFKRRYSMGLLRRIQQVISAVVIAAGLWLGYESVAAL